MGVCFQNISGREIPLKLDMEVVFIWICGRREDRGDLPGHWHLQGVSDDEETALAMCRDETYFIGPIPKNVALPHGNLEWVGCYFPLKKESVN